MRSRTTERPKLPVERQLCKEFKAENYKEPKTQLPSTYRFQGPPNIENAVEEATPLSKFDEELHYDLKPGSAHSLIQNGVLQFDNQTGTYSFAADVLRELPKDTQTALRLSVLALAKYDTVGASYGYDTTGILWPLNQDHPKNPKLFSLNIKEPRQFRTLVAFANNDGFGPENDNEPEKGAPYVVVCVLETIKSSENPLFSDPSTNNGFENLLIELEQQPSGASLTFVYDLVVITYRDTKEFPAVIPVKDIEGRIIDHIEWLFNETPGDRFKEFEISLEFGSQSIWSGSQIGWVSGLMSTVKESVKGGVDAVTQLMGNLTLEKNANSVFRHQSTAKMSVFEQREPVLALMGAADNICLRGTVTVGIRDRFLGTERIEDTRDRLLCLASGVDYKILPPESDLTPIKRTFWTEPSECKAAAYDEKIDKTTVVMDPERRQKCLPSRSDPWRCIHPVSHGVVFADKQGAYARTASGYAQLKNRGPNDQKNWYVLVRNRYAALVFFYARSQISDNKDSLVQTSDLKELLRFLWASCLVLKQGFLQAYSPFEWHEKIKEKKRPLYYTPSAANTLKDVALNYQFWFNDKTYEITLNVPAKQDAIRDWHLGLYPTN